MNSDDLVRAMEEQLRLFIGVRTEGDIHDQEAPATEAPTEDPASHQNPNRTVPNSLDTAPTSRSQPKRFLPPNAKLIPPGQLSAVALQSKLRSQNGCQRSSNAVYQPVLHWNSHKEQQSNSGHKWNPARHEDRNPQEPDRVTSVHPKHSPIPTDPQFPQIPSGQLHASRDNFIRIYISHIVSPTQFYVRQISQRASAAFAKLRQEMTESKREPLLKDISPDQLENLIANGQKIFGVCSPLVTPCPQGHVERCQVVDWRISNGAIDLYVRLIDLGPTKWIPSMAVWKLDNKFCNRPSLTVQCQLFDTHPILNSDQVRKEWSPAAIGRFKELLDRDRPFVAFALNKEGPYQVMLYSYFQGNTVCINCQLVMEHLARTLTNWTPAVAKD